MSPDNSFSLGAHPARPGLCEGRAGEERSDEGLQREKQVKGWKRNRKIKLIEAKNKECIDLYDDLISDPSLRSG